MAYRVQNPVTGELEKSFDYATDADIEAAIAGAAEAYKEWSARPMAERGELLKKAGDLFSERKEELAQIVGREMGKPHQEAVDEAEFAKDMLYYYAEHGEELTKDREIPTLSNGTAMIRRLPIGVLLGVEPWNFPFYQIVRFGAPNLMLGNTILLKDADVCGESALAIEKIFSDAGLPKGVYTNVFATHDQVATIIADPRVQGVALTGSEGAGRVIGSLAGQHLKKSVLELGGTDPYIVLDSADVKASAKQAWDFRMANTGQVCNSNKRIIVMDDIYDEFVQELVELAKGMKPGTPLEADDEHVYSPLSSQSAADHLMEQLARVPADGGKILVGGERSDTGYYVSPAVVVDIKRGSDSYYDEFFGPVAEVYCVHSDAEAVEVANDTRFGLGSAVFSQDPERAKAVAKQIEAGMANVNTPSGEGAELPFGGVKHSGYGRELGPLGMEEFVNKQLYYVEN
ncbi:MAG: NAD-dependent succinate-semialdehyde dehydrogenase [Actinomycetaceae bacterium]|nr:NAD-dependent succinate-semialdehyde dehydrogenase [Arcanobacterium sp.]MDD7687396.1 NAD-dependent succinate-semialdehyde dehydrogenase [Actinomycetaceae bacterium]MDY5272871.1 NAD-dependent succinate-semialdehyde dehydrogenase [Arcanobacterium sp.]